jgi:hypothetical protein
MLEIVVVIAAFAGGYVAAIATWGRLMVLVNGAETEAARLKSRADALLAGAKAAVRS